MCIRVYNVSLITELWLLGRHNCTCRSVSGHGNTFWKLKCQSTWILVELHLNITLHLDQEKKKNPPKISKNCSSNCPNHSAKGVNKALKDSFKRCPKVPLSASAQGAEGINWQFLISQKEDVSLLLHLCTITGLESLECLRNDSTINLLSLQNNKKFSRNFELL